MRKKKKIDLNVNFTIPSLDNGVDIVKDFVDNLIMPAVGETGLLIKDAVTSWRLDRQVKMLHKAKSLCEKYKIQPKQISLKSFVPLLNNAGLEDDNYLLDKWSLLLANLVDSKQNITNNILPHLLSQVSKDEFKFLEKSFNRRNNNINELRADLEKQKIENKLKLDDAIEQLRQEDEAIKNGSKEIDGARLSYQKSGVTIEQMTMERMNSIANSNLQKILSEIKKDYHIDTSKINLLEIENLVRLGILDEIVKGDYEHLDFYANESDILKNLNKGTSYRFTALGEVFVLACQETNLQQS
nr:hypothetical protein [Pedobacter kyonggii]